MWASAKVLERQVCAGVCGSLLACLLLACAHRAARLRILTCTNNACMCSLMRKGAGALCWHCHDRELWVTQIQHSDKPTPRLERCRSAVPTCTGAAAKADCWFWP